MEQALQIFQDATGFTGEQQAQLEEMLKASNIKERPGQGGKKLKYVSGDYVIGTANRIFGFGKWGYRVLSKSHESTGDKEYYTADIELMVLGCPFPFPGEGIGVPQNTTVEQHEKARKEAVTDALKRALRHFGDQFGLSLYNEDNYVEDASGNPVLVKDAGKHNGNGHSAPPAKKVVDSTPVPTPAQLRARCKAIGMDYDGAIQFLFKRVVADDAMTPEMCGQFDVALKRKEAKAGKE